MKPIEEPRWVTHDGRKIPVRLMKTSHIINALKMLRREGFVSPSTKSFYRSCIPPLGEMAQEAFDREFDMVGDAPESEFIDIFIEELKRRGIDEQEMP